MKRSLTSVCLLACGLGMTAFAQTTAAPTTPAPSSAPAGPAKIAIIAFQQAVAQTNEGQRNFAQLRQKFEPKQAALKAQNDEIESLKNNLKTQGDKLSDQARAAQLKTIDDKEKLLQRNAEDAQNEGTSEMNEMYQQLAQKVYEVVQTYAQQSGYTLVVDISSQQSPILWANQSSDITAAIIQGYNTKSGVPAPPASAGGPAPRPAGTTNHAPTTAPKPATTTPK
jgi:outer membrane protein